MSGARLIWVLETGNIRDSGSWVVTSTTALQLLFRPAKECRDEQRKMVIVQRRNKAGVEVLFHREKEVL